MGGTGVQVMNVLNVAVPPAGEGVTNLSKVGVGLVIYSAISTTVMATAVLMGFAKAESTISLGLMGSISEAVVVAGFASAAADTRQMRLNPSTPAARTVNGAEYLRIYNLYLSARVKSTARFYTAATQLNGL